ncbi:MAG: hypothetical protein JXB10_02140 [Pirellulales bacterium]|nr:hypothetical protein [Pirellulales bacterium]
MTTLILDPHVEERLLEQRRAWGADQFDLLPGEKRPAFEVTYSEDDWKWVL